MIEAQGQKEVVMRRLRLGAVLALLAFLVPGAAAPQAATAPPRATLVFGDMASDVVGRLNVPGPNGERDAHFTATLSRGGAASSR
jgi:hypothetical protein